MESIWNTFLHRPATFIGIVGVLVFVIRWYVLPSEVRKRSSKVLFRQLSYGVSRFMASMTLPKCQQESIINGCIYYGPETPPNPERLISDWQTKFGAYTHFNSVPLQDGPGKPICWAPGPLNAKDHIVFHPPIVETERETIDTKIEEIINQPLDKTRPWWEVHVLKSLTTQISVVLFRIHHALGDGVSLVELFAEAATCKDGKKLELILPGIRRPNYGGLKKLLIALYRAVDFTWCLLYMLFRVVSPYHATTPFFDPRATEKFSDSVDAKWRKVEGHMKLDEIKRIKNFLSKKTGKHITVNDVLFAIFGGAIRRFLISEGQDVSKVRMTALCTAHTPGKRSKQTRYLTLLGNLFSVIPVELPIRQKTTMERILASNKTWDRVKNSMLVPASILLQKLMLALPIFLTRKLYNWHTLHNVTFFSNNAGPQTEMYIFGGKPLGCTLVFPGILRMFNFLTVNQSLRYGFTVEDTPQVREKLIPTFCRFVEQELEATSALCVE